MCGGCGSGNARMGARTGNPSSLVLKGLTVEDPVIVGEPNGDPVRHVKVITPNNGMRTGQAAWVTGDGVDAFLASDILVDITGIRQAQRRWKVGQFYYTDYQEAVGAGLATGITPLEVT